jgi:hypothetical protein
MAGRVCQCCFVHAWAAASTNATRVFVLMVLVALVVLVVLVVPVVVLLMVLVLLVWVCGRYLRSRFWLDNQTERVYIGVPLHNVGTGAWANFIYIIQARLAVVTEGGCRWLLALVFARVHVHCWRGRRIESAALLRMDDALC